MPQTQTPCVKVQAGELIPDPTTTTRYPGDVALLGNLPVVVLPTDPNETGKNTYDTVSVYDVPKDASVFSAGDPVYWNATGSPNLGTASTGAGTSTAAGANLMGFATKSALTGDNYVRTKLVVANRTLLPLIPTATVAAAGSVQGDAAAVATGFTLVTAADATKGVQLPTAVAGQICIIKNADVANAVLKIWPATGDAINALSVNAALSIAAKTSVMLVAYDATTWYTLPLLAS